jgi:hypothetical protein
MAEKTREEFLAEFAKNIFDETYFSTFTDDNAFFDAAKYLKDNGIPVSELDKQFKKLQQKYVGSRPRAKDNLFDIIGSEYGRSEVKGMRDRFGLDSTKELNSRTEARKEEKATEVEAAEVEALEEQPAEPVEVAEEVEPQAEAVQAVPKEQLDVDQGPTLENPAGLAAMADNLGRGVRDPKIKSIAANQRRNMEKSLNAQAARKVDEDIAKQRRADRTQKIFDDRDADLKEAWARSRTGRRTGLTFDELDADTQADMRNRYNDSREAGAYSDEKYEAYKKSLGVPVYDENGLVGYESSKKFEEDMGDQQFRENPNQPNSIQKRERKDKAMLDDIRGEIKETGKHPFGEGPILGTDHARDVELSKKFGGDMAGLKKAARDVRDNPVGKANYAEAFLPADFNAPKAGAAQQGPSRPLNEGFTAGGVVDKFKSSTANLMNQESEATNSVLDNVPMPQMPRPTFPKPKPGPFHYTNKTKNYPVIENYPPDNDSGGLELTRTSPEFAVMPPVKYPSSNQPGMELTRTSPDRPTMDVPAAQYRKQTPGFGRSGKKQINIPQLDRLDMDNYDYRPNAPKHPGGAGMGRSGKKQYNIPALDFLDLDNYFYNQ